MVNKIIIPLIVALDTLCLVLYYFMATGNMGWTCFYYTIDKVFIVFLLGCIYLRKQIKPYDKIYLIYGLMVNASMWALNTLAIYATIEVTRANITVYKWLLLSSITLLIWKTIKELRNDARKRHSPL